MISSVKVGARLTRATTTKSFFKAQARVTSGFAVALWGRRIDQRYFADVKT
jgi:hypothetical protein